MQTNDSDAGMVESARGGDRVAFVALLDRHYPALLRRCRGMLRDASLAEDAAQEAVLQAFLSLDRLREPARFGPWLVGIGLNVCRRWLQYRQREAWSWDSLAGGRLLPEPVDIQAGPETLALASELRTYVQRAVAALPNGQQAAVQLVYLQGLSQSEAASVLGIGAGAIKTRLFKARRSLRRYLDDIWQEEGVMTTATRDWVDFRVKDVRHHAGLAMHSAVRYSVILEESGGEGRQSTWGIGPFEAEAMAVQLAGVELPRPLPYTLMARVIDATGGQLREVRLARMHERVGYAELMLDGPSGSGSQTVESRVSDALILALVTGAPIRIAGTLLSDEIEMEAPSAHQQLDTELYGDGTEGASEIAAGVTRRLAQVSAPPSNVSP